MDKTPITFKKEKAPKVLFCQCPRCGAFFDAHDYTAVPHGQVWIPAPKSDSDDEIEDTPHTLDSDCE